MRDQRYTLDIVREVDGRTIVKHVTDLTESGARVVAGDERMMPGHVAIEMSEMVPGDRTWARA